MARKPRLLFEGAIYHVTFRGNARAEIFADDADRERLQERLAESVEDFGVRVYLYCFMSNHVHLLVETPRGNLSQFMSSVLTGYTVYFNRRHRRVGHLMQGRYGAQVVEGDEHLLRLSRYIHLNPVFVSGWEQSAPKERILALRGYRWSSYRGYVGLAKPDTWIDRAPLLAQVGRGRTRAEKAYRQYVEGGLARTDEEFVECMKGSPWGIGSESFLSGIRDRYEGLRVNPEDKTLRRHLRRRPVEKVLSILEKEGLGLDQLARRRRDSTLRAMGVYLLIRHAGLSQREVAQRCGMQSGSSVSHLVRQLKKKLEIDRTLRRRFDVLETAVNRYFKG